jgi:hypothetical protein
MPQMKGGWKWGLHVYLPSGNSLNMYKWPFWWEKCNWFYVLQSQTLSIKTGLHDMNIWGTIEREGRYPQRSWRFGYRRSAWLLCRLDKGQVWLISSLRAGASTIIMLTFNIKLSARHFHDIATFPRHCDISATSGHFRDIATFPRHCDISATSRHFHDMTNGQSSNAQNAELVVETILLTRVDTVHF